MTADESSIIGGREPSGPAAFETVDDDVRGTVRVSPAVLIELIELTVQDIPGVVGFEPRRRMERILPRSAQSAGDRPGSVYERGGIRVRVDGDRLEADVSIRVGAGVSVLEVGRLIQRNVAVAASRMLGMTVSEVNVHVAEIEPAGASPD